MFVLILKRERREGGGELPIIEPLLAHMALRILRLDVPFFTIKLYGIFTFPLID